jgi:DNA-binding HxlR family transcriptional regulator
MSRMIDRLINELVEDGMVQMKKLKKAELIGITKDLLTDNFRELTDDTIIKIYEERYNTNLSGV